jgi:hypothetical protein
VKHHLRTGRTAIVVRVLLVVRNIQMLVHAALLPDLPPVSSAALCSASSGA